MDELLHTLQLENGVILEFRDLSNRYFGDYHRICIEVRCRLPLTPGLFADARDPAAECHLARKVLGEEAVYTRMLEKMGVPGAETDATRRSLVDDFMRSSLAYFRNPRFPGRLVTTELDRHRHGRRPRPLRP